MTKLNRSFKDPLVQQYILELLFPIAGFWFFDWSFLVIVLFYLVDQLGNQVNFFARLRFVQTLFLPPKKWLFSVSIFSFLILFLIELFWLYRLFSTQVYNNNTQGFWDEFGDFLMKEFWLFLPLLIVANYLKDKMSFYKTDLPYQEPPEKMVVFNLISVSSTFVLIALIYGFWALVKPSYIWLIIVIAILKLLFDVFILPSLKRRALFKRNW